MASRINKGKSTPGHYIVKVQSIEDKEFFKADVEEK